MLSRAFASAAAAILLSKTAYRAFIHIQRPANSFYLNLPKYPNIYILYRDPICLYISLYPAGITPPQRDLWERSSFF